MKKLFPLFDALSGYDRSAARADVTAGLTTAVMLIPQAMGYAMLAGLPPIVGLYASVVPLVLYGLLGTSRQLAVGPVAMVSLLVATGVAPLAGGDPVAYLGYALLLAAMVGAVQLVMGLARLGFLVNFLSHPVISGFTSAAALIIGFSQLKHLLGFDIPRSHHVHTIVGNAIASIGQTHPATLAIGAAGIVALVLLKRYAPRFPRALAVVVGGSLAVIGLDLHHRGVAIVGDVPSGLPSLTAPTLDATALRAMLPIALTISLVGFMESIAVAKKYAHQEGYDVDANRELIGLGVANLGAAVTGGYPVTGGFSRTAVNAQAGARSGVASIVTAAVIALTLAWFTPLFYYLPKAILASIIMTAVFGLVDVAEVKHLWHVHRRDLALLAATFVATLTLGIEQGVALGVGASLAVLVFRTTRPHVAVLGRLPGTNVFRNVARFPEAETTPGLVALRLDAQLYFGNVDFLTETIHRAIEGASIPLRVLVVDASGMNQVDASGEAAFRAIDADLEARGITLHLAGVKGPVRDVLQRSGLWSDLAGRCFFTVDEAVRAGQLPASAPAPPTPEPDVATPSSPSARLRVAHA